MYFPLIRRFAHAALVLLLASGFSAFSAESSLGDPAAVQTLSNDGAAAPGSELVPDYVSDVQPILTRRCIACHGCLGSPCNVKLDSFRGLERGGFGLNAYSSHVRSYPRTDMDAAHSVAEWRKKGFYPIVSREGESASKLDDSLLYLMAAAGMNHNGPGFSREALDGLRPERYKSTCPSTATSLKALLKQQPAVGMPFGLPALSNDEFDTLKAWVAGGSPGPSEAQKTQAKAIGNPEAVLRWEAFFNGADKRAQLVSRYIFEHVFLATIVLEESPEDQFRLVRSKTPPTHVV